MFSPVTYLTHCSKTYLYKTEILKERTGRQGTKCRNKRKTSNRRKRNKHNARTRTATTILTKQVPRNNKHIKWQKATNTAKRERREANKRSCCKSDTSARTFSHRLCRVISLFAPCSSRQERRTENKRRGEERRIKQTAVTLSGRNPPGAPAGHQTGLGMRGQGDSRHCYKQYHSEGD